MNKKAKKHIKYKFFFAFTSIICSVMIVLYSIFMLHIFQTNEARGAEYLTNTAEITANQLDSIIQSMDNLALQIISNPVVIASLNKAMNSPITENYFESDITVRNQLISNLASINSPNMHANRINVYNDFGDYASIGIYRESNEDVREQLLHPDFSTMYDSIMALDGYRKVFPPASDKWGEDKSKLLFTVVREIRDVYHSYGVVEIERDISYIDNLINEYMISNGISVYILFDGEIIYPYDYGETINDMAKTRELTNAIKESGNNPIEIVNPISKKSELLVSTRLKTADWELILAQPTEAYKQDFRDTASVFLISAIIIFSASTFLTLIVTNYLTKPIELLRSKINNINASKPSISLNQHELPFYKDEFEMLERSFTQLFRRLDESKNKMIEMETREIKAQVLALQSQMNPHFLYNTLSVINASAIEEDHEKTSKLCMKLSSMLRYSTSLDSKSVTMREELTYSEDYLELMKERYEEGFNYQIICEDELADLLIPKMTLQPLIENAFNHGLKHKRPPWKIEIQVLRIKDNWILEISDNGIGFSEDKLNELHQRLNTYFEEPEKHIENLKIGGLALLNILIRLKYIYSDKFIFNVISSKEMTGTKIQVGGLISDKSNVS